jgi:drug/metabolite transporter (DMT)-like permease
MILATLFWGAGFFFTKLALQEISPTAFLFFRYSVATISLLPILAFYPISFHKKLLKQGLNLGLLQIGLMFTQTLGLETISASLSGFLTGFYIVFVLIIRFIINKQMPSVLDIVTSLICLGGLGLLTHSFEQTDILGIAYTLVCAFCMAIYIYVLDRYSTADNAFALTFLQMVSLVVFAGFVLILTNSTFQLPSQTNTWVAIIFCGIGGSSLAYWLQNKAQRDLGAFKTSVILMLEPVFGTIFAYFGLGEQLYLTSYIGIGMILGSIAIINWRLKEA